MRDQLDDDAPDVEAPRRRRQPPVGWVLLGIVLVVVAALRPQQLLTTLQSPRVLALVLVLIGATVLLRRLGSRLPQPAASLLAATPALLAVVVLVLPTLRGSSVDEDLAGLTPLAGDQMQAEPGAEPAMADTASAPLRLATGTVEGIGHRGSGTASLVQLPDGSLVLRFEDLHVDPGPDYRVHMVPGLGQTSPGEGTEIADLTASSGNQNYPIDTAADLPLTALIWCEAFSVPIAAATLG